MTRRLGQRLLETEKLDPKAKRRITQPLGSFVEGEKLKRRMNARTGSRASAHSTQEA
jgi:hypothetical protein